MGDGLIDREVELGRLGGLEAVLRGLDHVIARRHVDESEEAALVALGVGNDAGAYIFDFDFDAWDRTPLAVADRPVHPAGDAL